MRTLATSRCDAGPRERNEDCVVVDAELGLYAVCDGMGGHAAGDVAARTAAAALKKFFANDVDTVRALDLTKADARQQLARTMISAVQLACNNVFAQSRASASYRGMGTTLTALLVLDNVAVLGHVGDSRLVLRRAHTTYRMTLDHTLENELIAQGMDAADAKRAPQAQHLVRGVGQNPTVQVDTMVFDLYPDDVLLLCSDGLPKGMPDDAVGAALQQGKGADELVDAAIAGGTNDNVSAIVLRVQPDRALTHAHALASESEQKRQLLETLPMFRGVSFQDLARIAASVETVTLNAGDIVWTPNALDDRFITVLAGSVGISLHDAHIKTAKAGDSFGETSIFAGTSTPVAAYALAPTTLLVLRRDNLRELCRSHPVLGVDLLWRFSASLSHQVEEIVTRGWLSA